MSLKFSGFNQKDGTAITYGKSAPTNKNKYIDNNVHVTSDFTTNTQIKKNAISFDIDFENIKENTLKEKNKQNEIKKPEVIPNTEDPNVKEETRYECPNCKRKFKREAYAKHVPICERVFQGKKDVENPKAQEKKDKVDNNTNKQHNKGFASKPKWENQSNELRAIIQSKRAEKDNNTQKNDPIIEIEAKTKPANLVTAGNIIQKQNSPNILAGARQIVSRGEVFYECELCNKKFTKINYESHLFECKQKYKNKKNATFNNKPNFGPVCGIGGIDRKPLMPAVQYGGFSNRPNFNMKFGKN